MLQLRESLVFMANKMARLRYKNIQPGSFKLYYAYNNTYIVFTQGIDYILDEKNGIVTAITANLTCYSESPFYQKNPFNHEECNNFGNYSFIFLADYSFNENEQKTDLEFAFENTYNSFKPTFQHNTIHYLVIGDSISTGAEASAPKYAYFNILSSALMKTTNKPVKITNLSLGGETSSAGLKRLFEWHSDYPPQLVSIAYGMNDQNRKRGQKEFCVSPDEYEKNITLLVNKFFKIGATVLLISPCLSNPRWLFSSGCIDEYTKKLLKISNQYKIPFADVTGVFSEIINSGKSIESLLYNDANHPTDYGHFLYAATVCAALKVDVN